MKRFARLVPWMRIAALLAALAPLSLAHAPAPSPRDLAIAAVAALGADASDLCGDAGHGQDRGSCLFCRLPGDPALANAGGRMLAQRSPSAWTPPFPAPEGTAGSASRSRGNRGPPETIAA